MKKTKDNPDQPVMITMTKNDWSTVELALVYFQGFLDEVEKFMKSIRDMDDFRIDVQRVTEMIHNRTWSDE